MLAALNFMTLLLCRLIRQILRFRFFMDFLRPICRPCYKNIIDQEVFVHPPNHFLLSPLCTFVTYSERAFSLCAPPSVRNTLPDSLKIEPKPTSY